MKTVVRTLVLLFLLSCLYAERPLMKDFVGINGHFNFRPALYRPTSRLVRNYHNMNWDVKAPGDPITFPVCPNGVDWEKHVYGKWVKAGFEVDLCAQFGAFGEGNPAYLELWEGQEEWIYRYGYEMASFFGPSGGRNLVTSIEIGNEPGNDFDDECYQRLFLHMSRGIRAADPAIKIVTATAQSGASDKYAKSLEETFASPQLLPLYDVINVHVYAVKPKREGQSPWDRSYPEDPGIDYLKTVDSAIAFRDRQAPDKEVWITEFGYDACTEEAMEKREGWAKKLNWSGVSDVQQAQYLLRSLFLFSERDLGRAYIYFYNDEDKASVHAASGLTRFFEPKASYWAVKHLLETLGEYRWQRVVRKEESKVYVYEYRHGARKDRVIWVVWRPTGEAVEQPVTLRGLPGRVLSAERMPLCERAAETVTITKASEASLRLPVGGSPVYVVFDTGRDQE